MATITNTLQKTKEKGKAAPSVFEYESGGENVKLSVDTVKKYLVNGGGEVTDQEVLMFMSLCRYQHLNPFLKEAYLIKYGNSPATMVTGKDVFTKRAKRNPNNAGKSAGIIVETNDGEIDEREGTLVLPGETIVGGWAKVYIKGYEQPEYASVSFEEYVGKTKDGKTNSQWTTKPATMIRKVAVVQALREAFPEDYAGMYSPEEIPEANGVLDEIAQAPEIMEEATVIKEPAAEIMQTDAAEAEPSDASAALFG